MEKKFDIHDKDWFCERIGKRIYRVHGTDLFDKTFDAGVKTKGFIIRDKEHADYVYLNQNENGLRYSDTPNKELA